MSSAMYPFNYAFWSFVQMNRQFQVINSHWVLFTSLLLYCLCKYMHIQFEKLFYGVWERTEKTFDFTFLTKFVTHWLLFWRRIEQNSSKMRGTKLKSNAYYVHFDYVAIWTFSFEHIHTHELQKHLWCSMCEFKQSKIEFVRYLV